MVVSAYWFGKAMLSLANKEVDWLTDEIKVALCTSSYAPAQDTDDYFSDVTNEVTGTGYTAGGAILTGKTITYAAGTNIAKYDADDSTWTTSTITARIAVVYVNTGNPATSPLLCWQDFGQDYTSSANTFTVTWDAAGIMIQTVS